MSDDEQARMGQIRGVPHAVLVLILGLAAELIGEFFGPQDGSPNYVAAAGLGVTVLVAAFFYRARRTALQLIALLAATYFFLIELLINRSTEISNATSFLFPAFLVLWLFLERARAGRLRRWIFVGTATVIVLSLLLIGIGYALGDVSNST